MRNNNQTNGLIKWTVILFDFLLLGLVLFLFNKYHPSMSEWRFDRVELFVLVCFCSLIITEYQMPIIIHKRLVSAADVLERVVRLTVSNAILSYLLMKVVDLRLPVGYLLFEIGTVMFLLLILLRFVERTLIKRYRQMGRNTRTVIFVGSDPELDVLYQRFLDDATTGYRMLGYYGQPTQPPSPTSHTPTTTIQQPPNLGSLQYLMDNLSTPERLTLGEDMYVCISRRERDVVSSLSRFCDKHLIRFYYIPVSVETLGIDLKREYIDDIEVYTTYENMLGNPVNKVIKRLFDVVASSLALLVMLPFLPIIAIIIKSQSPGPIFFKQLRTGIDGREFWMYKFRSMHVNSDADKRQATKDDPRKYAFGSFMRRTNIDELPQFWNVLKGDMSIVGPRPHMLAHTEKYAQLIGKFMVRHFVKPGMTGWAQVTGFRGETQELWQMEGRVKRDIWYMEHWSIWLDIRIIWLTIKSMVTHDENAY